MSTENVSWGKGGRCVGLNTSPPVCADCLEILGASTSWIPMRSKRSKNPNLIYEMAVKILRIPSFTFTLQ
jgi:hypothetical protein